MPDTPHQAVAEADPSDGGRYRVTCPECGGVISYRWDTLGEADEHAQFHRSKHQAILDNDTAVAADG